MNHARSRISFCRWLAVAALAFLSLGASARQTDYDAWQAFKGQATGTAKHTVTFGGNGTPLVTSGVPGPTQAGNMNFSHANGGWPKAGGTAQVPSPLSGKYMPTAGTQDFTKASKAAALGRFLARAAFPLAAGMALWDLAGEMGWRSTWDPAEGRNVIERATDGSYCTSGCLEYWFGTPSPATARFVTMAQACQAQLQKLQTNYGVAFTLVSCGPGGTDASQRQAFYSSQFGTWNYTASHASIPPYDSRTWQEMSEAEMIADIASKSGWPSSSAVSRALADAVNAGEALDTTGNVDLVPQQQTVTDTKTQTSSDGSTKTETTTCTPYVPFGLGLIEWKCYTETTVTTPDKDVLKTVVTTNPDGTTTTQTVTETTPGGTTTTTTGEITPESDEEKECPEGSTRAGCAKLDEVTGEVPAKTVDLTFTAEDLGLGAGTCPANRSISSPRFGQFTVSFAKGCELATDLYRPFVLVFSALAALAIVAGSFKGN